MIKKLVLVFLVVFILGLVTKQSCSFFRAREQETRPVSFLEKIIYERVNQERLKYNLPGLEWASDVADVARRHSEDMGIKGYFSHENKEGEFVSERLEKSGIVFTIASENIFKCENYPDVVEESVRGWMESPGHRENILNSDTVETGVGVYKVGDKSEYYITQNFIKRALKFIPLPSKMSGEEIDKIFNIVKRTIGREKYNYKNSTLKDTIFRELLSFGIPVEKDLLIEGFLKESPQLKLKADLVVKKGLIVKFTKDMENDKQSFSRVINPQSYSAVILIRQEDAQIEYLLIMGENSNE